jgi:ATP-dependent RNA helicase DDX51/DBP6
VVICSDAVGRGIDIADLDAVFNYNVPLDAKTFVHRAGRTARAGRSGHVVTLSTKEEVI